MKTVLVTGGAGFIGSHLSQRLANSGFRARILDCLSAQIHGDPPLHGAWLSGTAGVEFQRGSVTSNDDLSRALHGVDVIVHLAAETGTGQSMYEIARYADVNVQGTAMLMQCLASNYAHGIQHVVLASSRSVYGEGSYVRRDGASAMRITPPPRSAAHLQARRWEPLCPETGAELQPVPTREDDSTAPASIYAATKLMQEDLVRITCGSLGIGHTILRLQNVYGEGQSLANPYTGLLSVFSTRIRRGLPLPIFEDGAESRDFIHVSDVVESFMAAIGRSTPANTVINVGSGIATSVLDVARALAQAFGAAPQTELTGQYRIGDIRHNVADISRLQSLLGVRPRISLKEGLARFASWVLRQPLPEDRLGAANAELQRRRMLG